MLIFLRARVPRPSHVSRTTRVFVVFLKINAFLCGWRYRTRPCLEGGGSGGGTLRGLVCFSASKSFATSSIATLLCFCESLEAFCVSSISRYIYIYTCAHGTRTCFFVTLHCPLLACVTIRPGLVAGAGAGNQRQETQLSKFVSGRRTESCTRE